MRIQLFLLMILFFINVLPAHEGHSPSSQGKIKQQDFSNELITKEHQNLFSLIQKMGYLHLVFLHFPIALLVMTGFAELLFYWTNQEVFNHSALFMLISGAILTIPTALLGILFSYQFDYEGSAYSLLSWHQMLGLLTSLLAIGAAILKKIMLKRKLRQLTFYYFTILWLAIVMVCITGYIGGRLTFG